jgi:hypothetical protein
LLAPECPQDKFMEGNDVKNRKLSYSKNVNISLTEFWALV